MNNLPLPRLSAFDPETKSEGSIDPLGLVPVADRLSVELVPGVRERMSHPRFLTLMAAGVALAQEFPADAMAKDGISSPLQVYEWYVVQALVKNLRGNGLKGLPGSEKTASAYKKDLPLNAARYLRVPGVFGFNGVYKTLARESNLIQGNHLGEQGDKLVRVWEKEQSLEGYYSGVSGPGRDFKDKLRSAIADGLKAAQVDRRWNWPFFDELALKMHPNKPGTKEIQILFDLIRNDKEQKRLEIVDALLQYSNEFDVSKEINEYRFHQYLIKRVREELRLLLKGIQSYELFSRTLSNAFEGILYSLSRQNNKGTIDSLKDIPEIHYAAAQVPVQYVKAVEALASSKEHIYFEQTFGRFSAKMTPAEFAESIIDHHHFIQKRKPPFGKLPWIERVNRDTLILRPSYTRRETLVNPDPNAYVYFYRTNSLISFLKDLRKVNG